MKKSHVILMALCAGMLVACDNNQQASTGAATKTVVSGREGMPAVAMKNSCDACHTINTKKVGPAWMDVSKRYKGNPDAVAYLDAKIKKGGAGAWGAMPMPPNSALPEAERKELVSFILGLAK
ncbi:MAG TPA: c-type cytochrome [Sideroxyarcus sp.]|nr:c-type cytochrome [Sideroxyarcus sp.]